VSGVDRIEAGAAGFGGGLVAGGAAVLVSGAAPVASGGGGQFLYNTTSGQLSWDADGDGAGAAVVIATLTGAPALVAADIVISASGSALQEGAQAMAAGDADALRLLPEGGLVREETPVFDWQVSGPLEAWPRPEAFGGGFRPESVLLDAALFDMRSDGLPDSWEFAPVPASHAFISA
jgi:hypothetical protein